MCAPSIVWFRLDLRLADNPALDAASKRGGPVVPVFIWAPEEEGKWPPGAASRWWLHQSLLALDSRLRAVGSRLVIRRGPTLRALRALMKETGADAVFWNRRYEPALVERDRKIQSVVPGGNFNSALLVEPWEVMNAAGKPFRVFTPFWRACMRRGVAGHVLAAPRQLKAPRRWPDSLSLPALELEPRSDWAKTMRATWRPGESGAHNLLTKFRYGAVAHYNGWRDRPDVVGTSRLSPHLHFGEIGARQVWRAIQGRPSASAAGYLRQLIWREFAHHLLFHFPHTTDQPMRDEFKKFPWRRNGKSLKAWQQGLTGYPIVDAGMRELWATGWMHNRARMSVASFLVKDLLIPWQDGARWFWDTLVDADLANNTLGWQWVAGCGADAAPFFRIFSPQSQAEKFDPNADYVRRWVPEWGMPAYAGPIVNHAAARERALEAFAAVKRK
ncbi:MAG TPA: deoxyribodipyrimidine photo-lyase [Verrucomicrobiae bacterium]|nr:deoxyribodipyrimidine photo-lyase [Verrucomicrobiae bacterium]